jgi:hypothetical protein
MADVHSVRRCAKAGGAFATQDAHGLRYHRSVPPLRACSSGIPTSGAVMRSSLDDGMSDQSYLEVAGRFSTMCCKLHFRR